MASPPVTRGLSGFLLRRLLGSAISNATGYALGGAIQPTLDPFVQTLENETWTLHQALPLDADIVAEAELRGLLDGVDASDEAGFTGVNPARRGVLRRIAGQAPPIEMLLSLRRRAAITEAQLDTGIEQLGYLDQWRVHLKALRAVLPSVTDMVRFAVREVYNPQSRAALDLDAEFPDAFGEQASLIGLSREQAGNYWAAHWELPSYEQGAQMMFRGEISPSAFSGLLKALDYAPVWRGPLDAIARAIPTLSDMIRFAVREVYNPQQRQSLGLDADYPDAFTGQAALHGLTEQYARDYWAAHWRLPSAQQGYRMLWRGEISEQELAGLLKALDYSSVWRDRLRNIAYLVPGRIDLKRMFRFGILERGEVLAGYRRIGYTAADAERLTQIAEAEAASGTAGTPWGTAARRHLFLRAHREFLSYSLSSQQVHAIALTVGATATEANTVVNLWTQERDIVETELTASQVRSAYAAARLTLDDARARLQQLGYSPANADIFLGLAPAELTPAEVRREYARNVIQLDAAVQQLVAQGFTEQDARGYLAEVRPELSARDIKDAFQHDAIDEATARERLAALGYPDADIDILIATWAPAPSTP